MQIEYFDAKTREIKTIKSKTASLNDSIPQGTVLRCVLFLVYINDLLKKHTKSVLLTDDVCRIYVPQIIVL